MDSDDDSGDKDMHVGPDSSSDVSSPNNVESKDTSEDSYHVITIKGREGIARGIKNPMQVAFGVPVKFNGGKNRLVVPSSIPSGMIHGFFERSRYSTISYTLDTVEPKVEEESGSSRKELEARVSQLEGQLSEITLERDVLNEDYTAVRNRADGLQRAIVELRGEYGNLRDDYQSLEGERDSFHEISDSRASEMHRMETELAELHTKLEDSVPTSDTKSLEDQIGLERVENQERVVRLQALIGSLDEANERLRDQVVSAKSLNLRADDVSRESYSELHMEHDKLKALYDDVLATLRKGGVKIISRHEDIDRPYDKDLRKRLENAAEYSQLRAELADMKQELDQVDVKVRDGKEHSDVYVAELQGEKAALRAQLEEKSGQVDSLEASVEDLKQKVKKRDQMAERDLGIMNSDSVRIGDLELQAIKHREKEQAYLKLVYMLEEIPGVVVVRSEGTYAVNTASVKDALAEINRKSRDSRRISDESGKVRKAHARDTERWKSERGQLKADYNSERIARAALEAEVAALSDVNARLEGRIASAWDVLGESPDLLKGGYGTIADRITALSEEASDALDLAISHDKARQEAVSELSQTRLALSSQIGTQEDRILELEERIAVLDVKTAPDPEAEFMEAHIGYLAGYSSKDIDPVRDAMKDLGITKVRPAKGGGEVFNFAQISGRLQELAEKIRDGYAAISPMTLSTMDFINLVTQYFTSDPNELWSPQTWDDDRDVTWRELSLAYRKTASGIADIIRRNSESDVPFRREGRGSPKIYRWGDLKNLFEHKRPKGADLRGPIRPPSDGTYAVLQGKLDEAKSKLADYEKLETKVAEQTSTISRLESSLSSLRNKLKSQGTVPQLLVDPEAEFVDAHLVYLLDRYGSKADVDFVHETLQTVGVNRREKGIPGGGSVYSFESMTGRLEEVAVKLRELPKFDKDDWPVERIVERVTSYFVGQSGQDWDMTSWSDDRQVGVKDLALAYRKTHSTIHDFLRTKDVPKTVMSDRSHSWRWGDIKEIFETRDAKYDLKFPRRIDNPKATENKKAGTGNAEYQALLTERNELESRLGNAERQLGQYVLQVSTKTDDLQTMAAQLNTLTEEKRGLRSEYENLKTELSQLQAKPNVDPALARKVALADKKIAALRGKLEILERYTGLRKPSSIAPDMEAIVNERVSAFYGALERSAPDEGEYMRSVVAALNSTNVEGMKFIMERYASQFPNGITEAIRIGLHASMPDYVLNDELKRKLRLLDIGSDDLEGVMEALQLEQGKLRRQIVYADRALGRTESLRTRTEFTQAKSCHSLEELDSDIVEIRAITEEYKSTLQLVDAIASGVQGRCTDYEAAPKITERMNKALLGIICHHEDEESYTLNVILPQADEEQQPPVAKTLIALAVMAIDERGCPKPKALMEGNYLAISIIYDKERYDEEQVRQSAYELTHDIAELSDSSTIGKLGITLRLEYIGKCGGEK